MVVFLLFHVERTSLGKLIVSRETSIEQSTANLTKLAQAHRPTAERFLSEVRNERLEKPFSEIARWFVASRRP